MTDRPDEPLGPPDGRVVPRFAEPSTFARLPRADQVQHADVAVVGVPFDAGVSYRPGARFGPAAIRAASKLLRPYHPELRLNPFGVQQVVDAGDIVANPFDIAQAIEDVQAGVEALLERADRVVTLGGDHTIALPILRAVHRRYGQVALLHFDAHLDTWDTYFGAPYTHGTPFRRAGEEGLFDPARAAHVGIRGPLYAATDLDDDGALGFRVISTTDVARDGAEAAAARIRAIAGDTPLYISIDIDVLDPAHAPGTGTPEPGGLTTRELQTMLRALSGAFIVGADVVEVSPAYDHAELTALAAANVTYELLGLLGAAPKPT